MYFGKSGAAVPAGGDESGADEEEAAPARKTIVEQEIRAEYGLTGSNMAQRILSEIDVALTQQS